MTGAGGDGSDRLDPDVARAVGDFVCAAAGLPMDRLLDVEDLVASAVGARSVCIFVVDYAQQFLSPVRGTGSAASVEVDTTVHGRVFQTGQAYLAAGHVIAPLVEGRDRIGVVDCVFDHDVPGSVDLVDAICAALLLVLVSKRRYTDLVLRSMGSAAVDGRRDAMGPAPTAVRSRLRGIDRRRRRTSVFDGGDSFDYATNGDLLEFVVIDAVGHGMPAVLKSMAAITTYRNVRRGQRPLETVYNEIDRVMVEQFGHSDYVTGVIASLRTSTGELTWINAGHPEPLLVRDGSVMPTLHCAPSRPMGLGGTVREQQTITLQAADRVLVFTDGVVERRHGAVASPHLAPLTDLLLRATRTRWPAPDGAPARPVSARILPRRAGRRRHARPRRLPRSAEFRMIGHNSTARPDKQAHQTARRPPCRLKRAKLRASLWGRTHQGDADRTLRGRSPHDGNNPDRPRPGTPAWPRSHKSLRESVRAHTWRPDSQLSLASYTLLVAVSYRTNDNGDVYLRCVDEHWNCSNQSGSGGRVQAGKQRRSNVAASIKLRRFPDSRSSSGQTGVLAWFTADSIGPVAVVGRRRRSAAAAESKGGVGGTLAYSDRLTDALGLVAERLRPRLNARRSLFTTSWEAGGSGLRIRPSRSTWRRGTRVRARRRVRLQDWSYDGSCGGPRRRSPPGNPSLIRTLTMVGPATDAVEAHLHTQLGALSLRGESLSAPRSLHKWKAPAAGSHSCSAIYPTVTGLSGCIQPKPSRRSCVVGRRLALTGNARALRWNPLLPPARRRALRSRPGGCCPP